MIEYFTEKLILWLLSTKVITESEKKIYQFGIFQLIINIINFVLMIIIAFLMDELFIMLVFMVSFLNLRRYAGGYHADTIGQCFLISIIITIIFLLLLKIDCFHTKIKIFSWIISNIVIILLAPIQNKNKELDKLEKTIYRKKTLQICFIENISILLCIIFNYWIFFHGLIFGQIMIAISLYIGKINLIKN